MTLKALMAWPLLRLQMMRVGHGFTVHSPFAYRFIMCCLRERLPYYAFCSDVTSRAGRRLFRVAAFFNPSTVCYVGPSAEARRVVALACPRVREVGEDADLTYVAAGEPLPADFRVLYAENRPSPLSLLSLLSPPGAMTFSNGKVMIAVRRHGLPAQSFLLKF